MNYSQHVKFAEQLAFQIKALADVVVKEPELHELARVLYEQALQVENDRLTVVVAGDFNRGKSTLLNAFLGVDLLPRKAVPSTAIVTLIGFGPPGVRIMFKDKTTESLDLAEFKRRYVLNEADHAGKDRASTDRFSAIDYAEVSYEIELCRHRVQLVDSPGLNDDVIRTDRTQTFLKKADAVVMLLDATTPVTQAETEFIEMMREELRQSNIFFVINKWNLLADMVSDPSEYIEIEGRFRQKLGIYCVVDGTDVYDARVHRVNAKQAVECRMRNPPDEAGLKQSGVLALESAIEKFLTEERGALRASSVLGHAQMTCDRVTKYVHARRASLYDSVEDLERKSQALAPQLDRLRRVRKHVSEFLNGRSLKLQNFVLDSLRDYMSKANVAEAVGRFDLSEITGRWLAGSKAMDVVLFRGEEERLESKIERQLRPQAEKFLKDLVADWRRTIATPGMKTEAVELMGYLRAEAEEYRQILAEIERLTGEDVSEPLEIDEIIRHWLSQSLLEGDLVGSLKVSEGMGIALDMAPLVASIAAEMLLHLKGAFIPVVGTIVALLLSLWRQKSMVDKMMATIVDGLATAVKQIPSPEQAALVRTQVDAKFKELEQKVTFNINQDIADREANLRAAIEHKVAAEFDADRERDHLNTLEEAVLSELLKLQTLCLRRPV